MAQARKNRTGQLAYFAFLASLALFWPTETFTGAESGVAGFRALATWQAGQESQLSSTAVSAESFDTPVKTVTVDLGQSPWTRGLRNTLTCYYFPDLMVKEYDERGSSAEWSSILRRRGELPECELSHERGERVIGGSEWSGYFKGVKDTLVFLDADDAFDGELSFAVYDSVTGKRLFADWAYDESTSGNLFSRVQVIPTEAGYFLKYVRVAEVECDLHSDGRTCWEKVKAKLDLKTDDMPVCIGYEHISDLFGTDHVESRVAYPVEVTLFPDPVIRTVAGPVRCWPTQ